MNLNQKLEEIHVFFQNCTKYGVNHMKKGETILRLMYKHLENETDMEHEEIIGTGPDGLEVRLDVTGRHVTFTLEDADTIIDSFTFDTQATYEDE